MTTCQRSALARAVRLLEIHALDDWITVGRRLATSGAEDVVDAHLAVVAEHLGAFILMTTATLGPGRL